MFERKSSFFLVSSTKNDEEYRKIDDFLQILEKSGVGNLMNSIYIKEKFNERGRKSYNPFNMFAMICYCFSKYESTLREIEELLDIYVDLDRQKRALLKQYLTL